ncbi:MAG: hypothetical protein HY328_14910 [Chloroflexi bacterium]|nr:hypothetical protein [Chloroflexota bacterium]
MSVNLHNAREFVYANGVLWERLIFGHLFEGRAVQSVLAALLAYKNSDNGFGNALEHDVRCPDSHPLALEFLLRVLRRTDTDPGDLLDGTAHWVEMQRREDGSLGNPAAVLDYPHAPWWNGGGQVAPDSITGHLLHFGKCNSSLAASTRRWVEKNLTLETIRATDWLFMNYHAYDYFMQVDDFPDVERLREATIANILRCAEAAPPGQHTVFFDFAPTPHSPVALAADDGLIERCLATVANGQQEDGGWRDEHNLPQWRPWTTICSLLTLRAYGRIG